MGDLAPLSKREGLVTKYTKYSQYSQYADVSAQNKGSSTALCRDRETEGREGEGAAACGQHGHAEHSTAQQGVHVTGQGQVLQ